MWQELCIKCQKTNLKRLGIYTNIKEVQYELRFIQNLCEVVEKDIIKGQKHSKMGEHVLVFKLSAPSLWYRRALKFTKTLQKAWNLNRDEFKFSLSSIQYWIHIH